MTFREMRDKVGWLWLQVHRLLFQIGNVPSLYGIAQPRLMFLGDSNTFGNDGTYTGMIGSYPVYMVQYLRTKRSDFDVVASQISLRENSAGSSLPFNEGHSGFTIAQLTAAYDGYCAAAGGPPDIVFVMAGTNDIQAGESLATMQANYQSLYATILSQNKDTVIFVLPPPVFVAGTVVGGNLTAWNALQAQFQAWLQNTFVRNNYNTVYSAASTLIGQGDIQSDGIHLNVKGQGVIGYALGQQLDSFLGAPRIDVLPKVFATRQAAYSVQCRDDTADYVSFANHPGFNPGSGSFTLACDFCPTKSYFSGSIFQYGSPGVGSYYELFYIPQAGASAGAYQLYWGTDAGALIYTTQETFGGSPGVPQNTWQRIVIMADAASQRVGLYVNGQLAGIATGVPAWAFSLENFNLASNIFARGAIGYYSNLYAAAGVPGAPGQMAALLAAEADYYLGRSLVPGKGGASFSLDNVTSDDVYAPGDPNPAAVFHSGAAFVPGYPLGTPARPWDYQPPRAPDQPPRVTDAITTPTTGTLTLSNAQAQGQIIPLNMTLTGNVTVVIPAAGYYVFDISTVTFSGSSIAFKYGTTTSSTVTAVTGTTGLVFVVAGAQTVNSISISQ